MNDPTENEINSPEAPPDENQAPQISGTPPRVVKVGVVYTFTPDASDPDADVISFSIENSPNWAVFDATTGNLFGVPALGDEGSYNDIRISVSDGQDSAALPTFIITVEPNTAPNMPPEISGTPPANAAIGQNYVFQPSASDPDGDALSFSISNRPSWAIFDTATGRLSGTPLTVDAGSYSGISITVSDNSASASLPAFSISVSAPNGAPIISGSPDLTVTAGTPYSFIPTASDPDGDTLVFSIQDLPSWASFDTSTGAISGTPDAGNVGLHPAIIISVSDGSLSDSLPPFAIEVVTGNRPPQISGTPGNSVMVGQNYSFVPSASDPDGDPLTFSIQNAPGWVQFDTATGALTGMPQSGDVGSYTNIVILASDGQTSASLGPFTITVSQVATGTATLSWTPPTQNTDGSPLTDLAGFRIYYGTSSGAYPNQVTLNNPGLTSYVVENLTQGTWYFVSTAFNDAGVESNYSNETSKVIN